MKKITSNSFPSKYEYNIQDSGIMELETRTTYFNEGQLWPIVGTNIGYLSIAKCMSTSFVEFLRLQNLLCDHFLFAKDRQEHNFDSIEKKLAFLRDPCQRYMSGLTEYIGMKFGADIPTMSKQALVHIVQALIDITDIDEHSIEQIHFFRGYNLNKFSVFMMDDSFSEQQLFDWMRDNGVKFREDIKLALPKINILENNEIKKQIYDVVHSVCVRHGSQIKHKCQGDYELIDYFKSQGKIINVS